MNKVTHPQENVSFTYGATHYLKTWPTHFNNIINGIKKFEVRKNDRGFKLFDILILQEWNPNTGEYTGAKCTRQITTILPGGQFGIESGYVVMGIEKF